MTRGGDEDGEREKADAETNRRDGDSSVVPNLYRREELLPLALVQLSQRVGVVVAVHEHLERHAAEGIAVLRCYRAVGPGGGGRADGQRR